jgi:hypothetical protein
MDVHRSAVAVILKAPYLVEQLVAGIHTVGVAGQMIDKLRSLGGASTTTPFTLSSYFVSY